MTRTITTRTPPARLLMALALVACVVVALACGDTPKAEQSTVHPSAESGSPVKDSNASSTSSITTGSGDSYRTIVDRRTEGELSPEDFRQASLLASRIVNHLNAAARHLSDEQPDLAREELEKGQALVSVVRELLPTTVVTTLVQDSAGVEVYRAVDRIQEDRIPLYEGLIAVEVIEPIAEAKQEAAILKGLRLADAELLHTSVVVELPYVERKLNAALRLVGKRPAEALAQLVLAQTRGMTFDVNERDDPLIEAQLALQLAERMVEQDRPEAAKANLQLAWNHLEVYRGLIAKDEAASVRELTDSISNLIENAELDDAAEQIRGIWDRVAGLVTQQPGEVRTTSVDNPAENEQESES